MAGVTFVPTYQGLSAADLLRPWAPLQPADFPMSVPHRLAFYRARNAIYHLFRALAARTPDLTVLAPDYNSGNEILAMRAAGARICYYPVDRRMQCDPEVVERERAARGLGARGLHARHAHPRELEVAARARRAERAGDRERGPHRARDPGRRAREGRHGRQDEDFDHGIGHCGDGFLKHSTGGSG